jgi:DNA-binding NarL/FixJ family response regulator
VRNIRDFAVVYFHMAGAQAEMRGCKEVSLNVYLVEDSPEIRVRLAEELERIPSVRVVGWAASERDAIEGIARTRPDLAVVDLHLETGSGLAVLNQFQGLDGNTTRFVVYSNSGDSAALESCVRSGALRAFDKTIEIPELLSFVAGMVSDRSGRS